MDSLCFIAKAQRDKHPRLNIHNIWKFNADLIIHTLPFSVAAVVTRCKAFSKSLCTIQPNHCTTSAMILKSSNNLPSCNIYLYIPLLFLLSILSILVSILPTLNLCNPSTLPLSMQPWTVLPTAPTLCVPVRVQRRVWVWLDLRAARMCASRAASANRASSSAMTSVCHWKTVAVWTPAEPITL